MRITLFSLLLLGTVAVHAQVITAEDSMSLTSDKPATYLGGYGNAYYQYNSNASTATVDLERVVLFIGHKFNNKISFVSEIEIEHALVEGGEEGGELAIEQAFLKFQLNRNSYLAAGLFLPRIGILNENHLPNTFNGNERTRVERLVIPSTWRELGVGYYVRLNQLPVDISVAIVNGLDCAEFSHGSLIRGGRAEGSEAPANNLATTAAVKYSRGNLTLQVSGYVGGTVSISSEEADSLGLDSGPFGTPVILTEANAEYKDKGLTIRALGALVSIPDAEKINDAFGNDTPEQGYGFYAEAAYDLLYARQKGKRVLNVFARYEKLNLNASIPSNTMKDPTLEQTHIVTGLTYFPIPQIAVKGDVRLVSTEAPGDDGNTLVNLGFGFSF
jgi:hypothetical protein